MLDELYLRINLNSQICLNNAMPMRTDAVSDVYHAILKLLYHAINIITPPLQIQQQHAD
jgi:hypothetical protein